MEQEVKDRLIDYLSAKKVTKAEFGRRIGVSKAYITSMRKSIQPDKLKKIAEEFPDLNLTWLQTGAGEMFKEDDLKKGLPMLDGEMVRAGAMAGFGEPLNVADLIKLPTLRWRDGDFAVRANGRSMIDPLHPDQSIPDGALIVLRPWNESYIQWGEMYCIYTTAGYAIKRLQPAEDESQLKCVSNNDAEGYHAYYIDKADILGLALVTNIIHVTTLHQ